MNNLADIPEKSLTASANPENLPLHTTFFYEQSNGRIIVVEEQEASLIHRKFKQVGVSDGLVFQKAMQEAKRVQRETGDLLKAQEILRQGERDELEAARGHFQLPRDYSRVDGKNNPIDMRTGIPYPPNRRT
jgi:hypothetical protein